MFFLALASLLNIALDLYFIVVLEWGVEGAAAATVISQAFAGLGVAVYVICRNGELLRLSEPLAYLFAPNTALGVYAIWWAIPIGWILADAVGFTCYRKNYKAAEQ